jgi:hypothetical protein
MGADLDSRWEELIKVTVNELGSPAQELLEFSCSEIFLAKNVRCAARPSDEKWSHVTVSNICNFNRPMSASRIVESIRWKIRWMVLLTVRRIEADFATRCDAVLIFLRGCIFNICVSGRQMVMDTVYAFGPKGK